MINISIPKKLTKVEKKNYINSFKHTAYYKKNIKSGKIIKFRKDIIMKKSDEFFELVCIYPDSQEFSLGFYSSQEIANEQKEICEDQAKQENLDLEYMVKNHKIIL